MPLHRRQFFLPSKRETGVFGGSPRLRDTDLSFEKKIQIDGNKNKLEEEGKKEKKGGKKKRRKTNEEAREKRQKTEKKNRRSRFYDRPDDGKETERPLLFSRRKKSLIAADRPLIAAAIGG